MALRKLRFEDDPILRKKTKPVKEINDNIKILLDDMIETMRENNGLGLAAPQVGILRRIAIIEIEDQLYELINPEILEKSGCQIGEEGCLSFPGISGYVERPEYLKVRSLNRLGEEKIIEVKDYSAVVFSHEIDHLDGEVYIDKIIPEDELEFDDEEFEDENNI